MSTPTLLPLRTNYTGHSLFPTSHGDIPAVALPSSTGPLLSAIYALMIIYLFVTLWNVILFVVMLVAPSSNLRAWNLTLAIFWNSSDPASAWMSLGSLSWKLKFGSFKWKALGLPLALSLLSMVIAVASIVAGILIPTKLIVGSSAPANPFAVRVPIAPEMGGETTTSKYVMAMAGPILRAMGSAEASKVTLRDQVHISQTTLIDSTVDVPQFRIDYDYQLSGVDLGLQHKYGLSHSVQGSCSTEYGWLQRTGDIADLYVPWNLANYSFPVTPDSTPGATGILNLLTAFNPGDLRLPQPTNVSFGLYYLSSHVASPTESNDALYMTEKIPSVNNTSPYAFRIKAGRPALSCWQNSLVCIDGYCSNALKDERIPPGIRIVLGVLGLPMISRVCFPTGPAALKSFFSPSPGLVVDAGAATTYADVERIVLSSYLLTRNLFRDSTLVEGDEGFENEALGTDGQPLNGLGDFVLQSGSVVTVSVPTLIGVPAALLFGLLVGLILKIARRPYGANPEKFWNRRLARCIMFYAPQLYRAVDDPHTGCAELGAVAIAAPKWTRLSKMIPIPRNYERDDGLAAMKPAFIGNNEAHFVASNPGSRKGSEAVSLRPLIFASPSLGTRQESQGSIATIAT